MVAGKLLWAGPDRVTFHLPKLQVPATEPGFEKLLIVKGDGAKANSNENGMAETNISWQQITEVAFAFLNHQPRVRILAFVIF